MIETLNLIAILIAVQATTRPSDVLEQWLSAVNTGNAQTISSFHRELGWLPSDAEIADFTDEEVATKKRAGRLRIVKTLVKTETRAEALVLLEDVEGYVTMVVAKVDSRWRLGMRRVRPVDYPPFQGLTEANLAERAHAFVGRVAKRGKFSGSVALAKDGKVLFAEAHGLAHRGFKVANRPNTKFNLASMGKMFTAVAIARFVDEGRLSFDTTVGEVLPDFPNQAIREKVTVRHLLGHQSGVGDIFNEQFIKSSKDAFKTVPSWLTLFQNEPLAFEPGSRFAYSNGGYCLLGAIIEKLSGQEYWKYLQTSLFDQLKMSDTGAFEADRDTPNLAFGYTHASFDGPRLAGEPKNNLFMHTAKGSPAGGSYSTVLDLVKFAEAVRRGRLIKPATLDEMTKASGILSYGLGFQADEWPSDRSFGHGGGFPGISGELSCFRKCGYTVVALANYDLDAEYIARNLSAMVAQISARKS